MLIGYLNDDAGYFACQKYILAILRSNRNPKGLYSS
jgi:hypothetical protein